MYFCRCCSVACCYSAVAAASAAVGHRVPDCKICCCGSLHLIPVFPFSLFKHDLFSMYPLAVLLQLQHRFFTYSTYIIHPRQLRARAEPKRALPRRGEAPLVVVVVVVFTLNRSLYPTPSAVPPVSFLILHPRDTNSVVTESETEKNQTLKNQGRQIKC